MTLLSMNTGFFSSNNNFFSDNNNNDATETTNSNGFLFNSADLNSGFDTFVANNSKGSVETAGSLASAGTGVETAGSVAFAGSSSGSFCSSSCESGFVA